MKRSPFILLAFLVCLLLSGFTSSNPDLNQYKRLPLSIKLKRLLKAGKDLYNRRRYEEAMAVFDSMDSLDKKNLDALIWKKKCEEQLFREKNETTKAQIIRKQGSLKQKESGFENWVWGPTAGHFEVRVSKPKPHIVPPKKIRPRAGDKELADAQSAAMKNTAEALFELAMVFHSRKETEKALGALEKAGDLNPDILSRDDEGLTAEILEDFQKSLETGKVSARQRIFAARVALLQGEWTEAIIQFIKAASKDAAFKDEARRNLKKIIDSGKTMFLQQVPEVSTILQAYAYDNGEDRFFLASSFSPKSPLYIFPFDLEFEQAAIKTIDTLSPDILFVFPDPFTLDTTRLWIVAKDDGDQVPNINLKLLIHLDSTVISQLNLSNYWVENTLPGNWSLVFGNQESFGPGFPQPHQEKSEGGVVIKAYQLGANNGKGPNLILSEFRKPLAQKIDIWKAIEAIQHGAL